MSAVADRPTGLSTQTACAVLGLPRATLYRARSPRKAPGPRRSPRRLLQAEKAEVLAVPNEDRFAELAPAQVYAQLLNEGRYLCSVRTMHRLLEATGPAHERRDQLRHPVHAVPQLVAMAPNQVRSWDITKLLGPVKWTYFYLYVVIDIFSRYAVGWTLSRRESTALAEKLIGTCVKRSGVSRGQLSLHADRGTSMTANPMALLRPILESPRATPVLESPTTTPSPRHSSRPSSTVLTSRNASARSKTPGRISETSSTGTTTSITTPPSAS